MAGVAGDTEDQGLMERPPTCEEIDSAAHVATMIARAMDLGSGLVVAGENGEALHIAPAVGHLIIELLGHVANENMVTLVPVGTMLTTQEAADMLNISRPHLTKLLLRGDIVFEQVGSHRRIRVDELIRYREKKARRQEAALAELARLGQEADRP